MQPRPMYWSSCRLSPGEPDQHGVHEIEVLYLAGFAAAQRTIYIESQYFAPRKIAEAMSRRLREPERPGDRLRQSRNR